MVLPQRACQYSPIQDLVSIIIKEGKTAQRLDSLNGEKKTLAQRVFEVSGMAPRKMMMHGKIGLHKGDH